jgi:DNA-binding NarL/FixJ family response regulator
MANERRSGADRRRTTTVIVVDAEPLIRTALAQTLASGGLAVVGQTDNGEDAIELALKLSPDVVLTAIGLHGMSGIETIEQLALLAPASRILVLLHSEQDRVVEAIVAGANGHILKTAPPEEIIAAVIATAAGESVLSPKIAGKLVDHIREREIPIIPTTAPAANAIRAALTTRELDILTLVAKGQSNPQIGRELSLSANTVANHVKSILAKLHLENRVQAAVHAVRAGIT